MSARKVTRRGVLTAGMASLVVTTAGWSALNRDSATLVFGQVKGLGLKAAGASTEVALASCPDYGSVAECIGRVWIDGKGPSVMGKRVLLKPNLVDSVPGLPSACTAPEVIEALVGYLRGAGAREVAVADGPSFNRDTRQVTEETGYGAMLRRIGVPFIDLNRDELVNTPTAGKFTKMDSIWLPKSLSKADIVVSVPKMKTHHWAGITGSMKNLFGVVPGGRYGWPKNHLHQMGIERSILGLTATVRPHFAIVDGVIGMEGDGPIHGRPRQSGVIIAGTDLVAVDCTAARVMGFNPDRIPHLKVAMLTGLGLGGENQVRVLGMQIAHIKQAYEPAPTLAGV